MRKITLSLVLFVVSGFFNIAFSACTYQFSSGVTHYTCSDSMESYSLYSNQTYKGSISGNCFNAASDTNVFSYCPADGFDNSHLSPKTCPDGSIIPPLNTCPQNVTCWDGSTAPDQASCPPQPPPSVTCWDGSTAPDQDSCPNQPPSQTCWDGSTAPDQDSCPPVDSNTSDICNLPPVTCQYGPDGEIISCDNAPTIDPNEICDFTKDPPEPKPLHWPSGPTSCPPGQTLVYDEQENKFRCVIYMGGHPAQPDPDNPITGDNPVGGGGSGGSGGSGGTGSTGGPNGGSDGSPISNGGSGDATGTGDATSDTSGDEFLLACSALECAEPGTKCMGGMGPITFDGPACDADPNNKKFDVPAILDNFSKKLLHRLGLDLNYEGDPTDLRIESYNRYVMTVDRIRSFSRLDDSLVGHEPSAIHDVIRSLSPSSGACPSDVFQYHNQHSLMAPFCDSWDNKGGRQIAGWVLYILTAIAIFHIWVSSSKT